MTPADPPDPGPRPGPPAGRLRRRPGGSRRPRRDRAAGAVVVGADRRRGEPGARARRRRQGRRAPGVERVDGRRHDGAVVRPPDGPDRVAVKPHASPVFHAIKYLLGDLDRSYLTRLRELGGLQAYPSRTKDPDRVDFSTGSVGLGPAAPLFAAAARRYVDAHFGARPRVAVRRAARRRGARRGQHLGGDGRRRRGAGSATCCGSSTSTGSRSTGWCPGCGSPSGGRSSRRPAGTSSR